jgi:DNA-directed RNA polymerase subunit alpha
MKIIANPFIKTGFTINEIDSEKNYGKFVIEPLERGFGQTIGNSLRRVLLSSLPGASVFAIKVEGAQHEFSALDGVEEDVTTIILNLKNLIIRINEDSETPKILELNVKGPAVVTAADFKASSEVEIINPELEIAHVSEGGNLKLTVYARNGRGYVTGEANKALKGEFGLPIGTIATDSNYSSIRKVNYVVENTRVHHDDRYERLTLEVWTDGSILPNFAVSLAAKILTEHLRAFTRVDETAVDITIMKEETLDVAPVNTQTIEDLDLTVRSYNCLKRAGIQTVQELIQYTEEEVLKIRNLGRKSFKEIKDKLAEMELSFKGIE